MNCPVCEDTGRVRLSAPVLIDVGDVAARFGKWYPCPVCLEGVKAEVEAIEILNQLKSLED